MIRKMLSKFLRGNLEAAEEKGTEDQRINMIGVVAQFNQLTGELSDFMGGRRELRKHAHHDPKHLADCAINAVVEITKIRRQIEG